MKKILENWKKFNQLKENELDVRRGGDEIDTNPEESMSPVESMREILEEVQSMATRLLEIEEKLRNDYESGKSNYHPGKDFQIAARKLADAKEYGSLATKINRFIENEVSLPIKTRDIKNKYNLWTDIRQIW